MKIAFILPGRGSSGGIRNTITAANHLINRGHTVRIFYGRQSLTPRYMLRNMLNRLLYNRQGDWLVNFRGPAIKYSDILDIEFYPGEMIVGVGMWCSAQLNRLNHSDNPKLQYIRGLTPWMPELMDEALSSPLPKIAVSSQVAEGIKAYHNDNYLTTIHNGIDQTEYYPSVSEDSRNGVGTIYSCHPAKDPQTILEALRILQEEMPGVPHYIFGAGARAKAIPRPNYTRCPSVEEARDKYSRSQVWILASRSEGLPTPVLEAMACGCAVVATDCGGSRDIITDGENGFLVEVGDVKQITDKTKLLLNDAGLRRKFVDKSQETVRKFSWDRSVDKLEKALERIIV